MIVQVKTCSAFSQVPVFIGNAQALADMKHDVCATCFMLDMVRPFRFRCYPFAQVMHQGGKTHLGIFAQPAGLLQYHHGMNAGIDLGMMLFGLRYAKQPVQFRQYTFECAAVVQYLYKT